MKLSVKDVAQLFKISEKTVYRWVQSDDLPHYRIGGQYRFSYSELLEWSAVRGREIQTDLFQGHEESGLGYSLSVAEALEAGGINYRIEGSDREQVLRQMVSLIRLPEDVNREIFLQFLLAREKLGSTAIGNGIAIPHVRNPMVFHSDKPLISLFFLEKPVDFGALDGKPVSKLFLIVSPNISFHLKLLSRLMFLLRNEKVMQSLESVAARNEILSAVRQAEAGLLNENPPISEKTSVN